MAAATAAIGPAELAGAARPEDDHRFVIWVLCAFAGWPLLKAANVQALEMFMLLHFFYLTLRWIGRGCTIQVEGIWKRPGRWMGWVMLCIFLVSFSSIRMQQYAPMYGPYFLRVPGLTVVLRYLELSLCVFYGLYAAELMRRDARLREYGMKVYLWSGMLSGWLVFLSLPIYRLAHIEILVYEGSRARGGFTEGGPYGLYLVTVCIVARILAARKELSQLQIVLVIVTMAGALMVARSKASAGCAVVIFLTGVFWKSNWRQKIVSVIAIAVVCSAFYYLLDVEEIWDHLLKLRKMAEVMVRYDRDNPSTAYGRVAASVIVPRMIAEHPITGIGFGNYPVMRNDPVYLGIMFPVRHYDLAGLGLLSLTAEIGIPSLIALYVIMFFPAYWANKTGAHRLVFTLALCQPVVTLLGAQVTFYYPWLMSAFAISFLPLAHGRVMAVRRVKRLPRAALPTLQTH
jgi:hypothetical protein